MKIQNNKFLWIYSVMLFSASLLLILISALSQSRITPSEALGPTDEQQAFNQTIQKSVTDLTKENEKLREELLSAKQKIASLEEKLDEITNQNTQSRFAGEATDFLIEAEMLFNTGNYAKSRDVLQNANAEMLSEPGKELYNWLRKKLASKGYKLQD
jgi:septal ring factor EnvC (AmiA/AmiB activator)